MMIQSFIQPVRGPSNGTEVSLVSENIFFTQDPTRNADHKPIVVVLQKCTSSLYISKNWHFFYATFFSLHTM